MGDSNLLKLPCLFSKQKTQKRKRWTAGEVRVRMDSRWAAVHAIHEQSGRIEQEAIDGKYLEIDELRALLTRSEESFETEKLTVSVDLAALPATKPDASSAQSGLNKAPAMKKFKLPCTIPARKPLAQHQFDRSNTFYPDTQDTQPNLNSRSAGGDHTSNIAGSIYNRSVPSWFADCPTEVAEPHRNDHEHHHEYGATFHDGCEHYEASDDPRKHLHPAKSPARGNSICFVAASDMLGSFDRGCFNHDESVENWGADEDRLCENGTAGPVRTVLVGRDFARDHNFREPIDERYRDLSVLRHPDPSSQETLETMQSSDTYIRTDSTRLGVEVDAQSFGDTSIHSSDSIAPHEGVFEIKVHNHAKLAANDIDDVGGSDQAGCWLCDCGVWSPETSDTCEICGFERQTALAGEKQSVIDAGSARAICPIVSPQKPGFASLNFRPLSDSHSVEVRSQAGDGRRFGSHIGGLKDLSNDCGDDLLDELFDGDRRTFHHAPPKISPCAPTGALKPPLFSLTEVSRDSSDESDSDSAG